jgi:CBS domain-containing membrane protein
MIAWLSGLVLDKYDIPLLVASMGAAAVLLFAAPESEMSQPWPLFIGHIVSALVGVTCAKYIPELSLASGLAVGGAILCMHLTRSLHPPGGAAALVAVIGGQSIQSLGYLYVLVPVLLNVLIIYIITLVVNNLVAGKPYPVQVEKE